MRIELENRLIDELKKKEKEENKIYAFQNKEMELLEKIRKTTQKHINSIKFLII